jgi:hypothetical protein
VCLIADVLDVSLGRLARRVNVIDLHEMREPELPEKQAKKAAAK